MEHPENTGVLARYVEIAGDIARRIATEKLREGERIFGRSALAGQYGVSPETIRRALALLRELGIVDVQPGVGVIVGSRQAAENYLAGLSQREAITAMQARLNQLVHQRNSLNRELEELQEELLEYALRLSARLPRVFELRVPAGSGLAGRALAQSNLRQESGATVLTIRRGHEEIFSPPPETLVLEGDLLLLVGPPEAEEKAHRLLNGSEI